MQNTLLIGLSRQVALGRELDVVANNIANVNTTGYKANGAVFEEYVAPNARDGRMSDGDTRVSFVRDRATWVDYSQGPIERTGNPLDIAIEGKGFIAVETPKGERFTRNGAFQINPEGQLVTAEGFAVLGESGPITFQPKDRDISISADGTISVREGNSARTEAQRGKLRVVAFENPGALQKDGAGTFKAADNAVQEADTLSRIQQGAVEKSNVRAVIEMTRMIEVTRAYTQVSNLLTQQHELQHSAIGKLAEVPN